MLEQETYNEKPKRFMIVNTEKQMKRMQTQIDALEKGVATLQGNQSTRMKKCIEQQKRFNEEKPDGAVTNVTDRLTALEHASVSEYDILTVIAAGNADLKSRMEDVEDSIGAFRLAIARIDSE